MAAPQSSNRYDEENTVMHRTRSWALRLVARLGVEVGVSAGLDAAMNNVSPSAPIRRSAQILTQDR